MKTRVLWVLALLSLLSSGLANAAGVGLVLDINGTVKAEVSGHSKTLDIAVSIDPETRIDLSKGSEISFVFYPTRQQFTLSGPAALQITDQGVKQLQGSAMKSKSLPENRSVIALGFQDRVVPAAIVMRNIVVKPKPVEPQDGETVLTERPEFAWTSTTAEPFEFSLTLDNVLVHQQRVEGNRMVLPQGLALLSGREYRWQIAFASGDKTTAKWGSFSVATADLRQQLQHDHPATDAEIADWVFFAMELDQAKLKTEAARVWKRVADLRPTSSKAHELSR
jgi:hypothetical protein